MTADPYLQAGEFIDSDHPAVRAFALEHAQGATDRERAVSLYYAVRDGVRYDPFLNFMDVETYRASSVLARGVGFCVGKSALYAACARAIDIAARIGFADVKNHLTTPRLRERMGSDVFIYHGYAELLLEARWVKATPVFNQELCQRFRVRPLEFDGREDSIFHPFDEDDRRHMEYVNNRGTFADVPAAQIMRDFRAYYPGGYALGGETEKGSFG
ncbi:MAG: transglutaminase family protein [Betaproteobacteria bacterium]|nr:MAG: transglutaminase family protein [Betaproteobacteria bacterium]